MIQLLFWLKPFVKVSGSKSLITSRVWQQQPLNSSTYFIYGDSYGYGLVLIRIGTGEHLNFVKSAKEEMEKIKGVVKVYGVFERYDLVARWRHRV